MAWNQISTTVERNIKASHAKRRKPNHFPWFTGRWSSLSAAQSSRRWGTREASSLPPKESQVAVQPWSFLEKNKKMACFLTSSTWISACMTPSWDRDLGTAVKQMSRSVPAGKLESLAWTSTVQCLLDQSGKHWSEHWENIEAGKPGIVCRQERGRRRRRKQL